MAESGSGRLTAAHVLEYPYRRSVGPVLGAFFSGLTEQRIVGVRARDGRVLVPPVEYDPDTGESIDEIVPVGPGGVVTTWSWVEKPRPKHPLDRPFAWALVQLDGAGWTGSSCQAASRGISATTSRRSCSSHHCGLRPEMSRPVAISSR